MAHHRAERHREIARRRIKRQKRLKLRAKLARTQNESDKQVLRDKLIALGTPPELIGG